MFRHIKESQLFIIRLCIYLYKTIYELVSIYENVKGPLLRRGASACPTPTDCVRCKSIGQRDAALLAVQPVAAITLSSMDDNEIIYFNVSYFSPDGLNKSLNLLLISFQK